MNYWLGGLMEVKSNDLYRMKGVLAIKDFDRRFVFQVGGRDVGGWVGAVSVVDCLGWALQRLA